MSLQLFWVHLYTGWKMNISRSRFWFWWHYLGPTAPASSRDYQPSDDLALLNSIVPENVTRAVNELMMRPPPRLKPRPPGMLSAVYEDGIPSSAGEITAKINSVSHRVSLKNVYIKSVFQFSAISLRDGC